MTKVSIIVPFHNVEKYISKCLSTLIYQSLDDIEIICINDASTDNSKEIVQNYAKNDTRIILLNTEIQSGQSYARNLGLEIASGEYIGFADSDDWCSVDMFEKLYTSAKQNNTDITMCMTQVYDDTEQKLYSDDYYSLKAFEYFKDNVFNINDAKDIILENTAVLWNKIYRRNFLASHNIKFKEGYIYEDLPFSTETFIKASRMNIVWESLYFYRKNRQFATMQNSDKKVYDRIPMIELTYNMFRTADFFPEKKSEIISWIIDDIFHRYTLLEEKYYYDYYQKMKDFFIRINDTMTEEDRIKLSSMSYCREEFECIVNGSYLEFWKFLIEKYKTANQKIKAAEHKCNVDIQAIKDYLEQYKTEKEQEKEKIIKWWEEKVDYMQLKKEEDMTNLYNEMQEKLVKQEYDLKAWQEELVRQTKEKITADYEWKIEELKNHYNESLINQKNYYENNFLLVKILLKLYKKQEQIKNKIGKILKKN